MAFAWRRHQAALSARLAFTAGAGCSAAARSKCVAASLNSIARFSLRSKLRDTNFTGRPLGPTVELEGRIFGALETPNKATSQSRSRLKLVLPYKKHDFGAYTSVLARRVLGLARARRSRTGGREARRAVNLLPYSCSLSSIYRLTYGIDNQQCTHGWGLTHSLTRPHE